MGRKKFPIEKLVSPVSSMKGSIHYNPYTKIPPSLWYGIGIHFENVIPEKKDLSIVLDAIILPEKDWRNFSGLYRPLKPWTGGSVYVDGVHNPVDVYSLLFRNRRCNIFDLEAELYIDFKFEGASSYRNIKFKLNFATEFTGISFLEPKWSMPAEVEFPEEWRIPSTFNEESVDELVARFATLDSFTKKNEGQTFGYIPKI